MHLFQLISLGYGINDYDTVSGCTLLHFAARCGSKNVGTSETAVQCMKYLLEKDANIYMRDLWTSMMALHYAAFYNVPAVVDLLLAHQVPLGELWSQITEVQTRDC